MRVVNLFRKFVVNTKQKGSKVAIRSLLLRILGIDEQIQALQFFLNELHSPAEIGPAKDKDLRIMQKCDASLLQIIDWFCNKHQIPYWLDYGTLLGAVRHGGFIPWDDDMDIAMLRDDYQRFYKLAKEELTKLGLSVDENKVGQRIGVAYKHKETGIWLDIFPVDKISCNVPLEKSAETLLLLNKGIREFRKKYRGDEDPSVLDHLRSKYINQKVAEGDNTILYHGPEFVYVKNLMHCYGDVFPLGRIEFEGVELSCPRHIESYLEEIYGVNYMKFPKSGLFHHGEASGRPPLSQWAKLHGVDMKDVLEELKGVYCKITS